MNFEDEDFDFPEGFLDEVLPPSRSTSHPTAGGWAVPAAPAPSASRADCQEDAGGFSCTPDSVSVSQMFGLRPGGGAAFSSRPGAAAVAMPSRTAPAARPPAASRAPTAAATPASPEMSTADPFADDDLMDADLLDACEAAEAGPAAARLPGAEDGRSESRDVPTGDDPGQRDMLDDIGELSRDAASRNTAAAAKSPSRSDNDTPARRHDTSTSDHRPRDSFSAHGLRDSPLGSGSRDSPLGRAAFSGGGSRDTPSGARTGGRRSVGSAVKRRFPGPAGILPITGSLLTLAHEISLQDDDPVAGGEDDHPTLHDHVTESQLSQPEEASAWESGAWHRLLSELRLSPEDTDGLPRRINLAAIRRAAAANQLRKVPLLAALLHSLEPTSDLSYQATFRDPTGQMEGTVAKDAFEHCGAALRPGCALLLRDVVVWRESARRLYLSVTRRSLVCLAPETAGSGDPAPVLRLSELDASELASARLVEEPPEQPVLQESPPPSPPRQQLYSSPQLPTGARGGAGGGGARGGSGGGSGGGGWRGRGGGRSWRGRGAGGSSGGRPAPYSANARRGGSTGSPASRPVSAASAASPALRTPPTASTPVNGAGSGLRSAPAAAASPALRLFPRPAATAPVPAPAPAPARPVVPPPATVKHKSDGISEAEIDAMFDDDDDVLFGQL